MSSNTPGISRSRNISHYLTSTVKKTGVLVGKDVNVSCSRLRTTVATEMAGYGDEDLKTFANCFMMHGGKCQLNLSYSTHPHNLTFQPDLTSGAGELLLGQMGEER